MELLVFLLAIVITWCLLIAVGVGVFWWRLDRANRVVPSQSTPAPMWWLVSPSRPANMHRRLRAAVAPAHVPAKRKAPAPLPGSVGELRKGLEHEAVTVDHHLVIVTHRPRAVRRHELAQLDTQVRRIEELSIRMAELERSALPVSHPLHQPIPATDGALDRLAQSVVHHEQAHAELAALERANGLDADALLRQITPAPPAVPVSRQPTPTPRPDGRVPSEPPRS